jgi:DNA-binding GntR family transcriptional regulator
MTIAQQTADSLPCGPIASPSTLRQAVVEQLRDAIVSGSFEPGALLRETALARHLGVSATPVREALGELASEGLVEIQAHRLKRVASMDFAATLDLFRVQAELWRLGYKWGMPHIGRLHIASLEDALDRYRHAIDRDEPLEAIRAGHAFHTIFITASANSELLRSTLDRRSLMARFVLRHGRETLTITAIRHHEAILRAFRKGDHDDVIKRVDQISERLFVLVKKAASESSSVILKN